MSEKKKKKKKQKSNDWKDQVRILMFGRITSEFPWLER